MEKNKGNGFIYRLINMIFYCFKFLNLVELVKHLFSSKGKNPDSIISLSNIGIDVFNILKFAFVGFSIHFYWDNAFTKLAVIYLMLMNLFTYFYYHCWEIKEIRDLIHMRRRFVNLCISFSFNILAFSYVYLVFGRSEFNGFISTFWNSLQLSLAFTFSGAAKFEPLTLTGFYLSNIQLIITFIYVAFLLSQTIPVFKKGE